MKITKKELQEMVRKCTKQVLQEALQGGATSKRNRRLKLRTRRRLNEWESNDDEIELINSPKDGTTQYVVSLWPGSGYGLGAWRVFADSEEETLYMVVAHLDEEGDDDYFCDDAVESEIEEMEKEGMDYEEIDAKIRQTALFIDASMEGANRYHYIYAENIKIRKAKI